MSAIKDNSYTIELNGKKYRLLFTLNAMDEMQDKFGGYDKLSEAFDQSNPNMFKDLRWMLTLLINEGLEDGETEFTEKQVGKLVHMGNLPQIKDGIFRAFGRSVTGGNEAKTDDGQKEETENEEGNMNAAQGL